jgi:Mg-chelatase subunit ChlD
MNNSILLTVEDIRAALLRKVKLKSLEKTVLSKIRLPLPDKTSSSPLFALKKLNPSISGLVKQWMQTSYPEEIKPGKLKKIIAVPYCPADIDTTAYLTPLLKAAKSNIIAVDASVAETGAALRYACSLANGLELPAIVSLVKEGCIEKEFFFQPGDFLPELAFFCFQKKIPLVPLGTPSRHVASEHQTTFNNLLMDAYRNFTDSPICNKRPDLLEKLAAQTIHQVYTAGIHFSTEREDSITRSSYTASRLYDLVRFLTGAQIKGKNVLALYQLKHTLDFPELVKIFCKSPASVSELYSIPEAQSSGHFVLDITTEEKQQEDLKNKSRLSCKIENSLTSLIESYLAESLKSDEIDRISALIAEALRTHPKVERPPGVRGTMAAREITQSYGLLHNKTTKKDLLQAAHIAFQHRTVLKQGENISKEDIFKSVFSRHVFNIPLFPEDEEKIKKDRRPLTPEELAQALAGLTDAAFSALSPEDGIPLDDPGFTEEAMNHPMVQQALKDAMEKGLLNNTQDDFQDMMNELEDRDLMDRIDSSQMTLTQEGQKTLEENLENRLSKDEITPEQMAEALKNSKSMPSPSGAGGEKIRLPMNAETEFLAEMMDYQHQSKSESSTLEDLYINYALNEKKGIKLSDKKLDYEKLKVMIHGMEKKGLVNISAENKRFTLSHLCLSRLLDGLIRRQESQVLERRAFKQEHEIDKAESRRYRRGDAFKTLSLRHTLRRIIRKGKTFEDINYTDLRSFEKKPLNQLDIAVCVDISASMKEKAKLRYAKMAVAELAKTAIEKHDRMGIVAFSNLGEVIVPLTDKITPLFKATMTLRADQFTNIGNGLTCAKKMLLKDKNSNPKYIILITDGEPNAALSDDFDSAGYHQRVADFSKGTTMETKVLMGTHHALLEAGKTSRANIKISVIYISPENEKDENSEKTAREIARIGSGRFHKVNAIERLPLEALAAVI